MPEFNSKSSASPLITDVQNSKDDQQQTDYNWLTKEYLENVLRTYKKDKNLKIIKINMIPATSKGENYASVLTRITIEYKYCDGNENDKIEKAHYIIKTTFEDDEFAYEKMLQYDIYNREMDIYQNIVPKLNKLLQEINDDDQLFAETIFVDYEHSAIMFEDLSVKSFVLVDRLIGSDMDHAKLALRKLAKMHATAAVLNEREGGKTLTKYDRGMFNRHTEAFSPFFVNTLDACGQLVSGWDDNYKIYGEKILKLKPYLMEYGKRVFDPKDNHFNTFIHGDFWTNNIMFNYNNNSEPNDAIMIDFQFSCWASPSVDLHYFFNTSLREELRLHHLDELLQCYYIILVDTLKALKFKGKIPTLYEFWIQYMEKSFYAFTSTCIVQPVQINTETAEADFHALMEENERASNFKRTIYKNPIVQKNLRKLLPIFNRKGLLDIQ